MIPPALYSIRTALFALLAALFLVLCAAVFIQINQSHKESHFFCGVRSGESALSQHPRYARGKELFIDNCACCHNKNMKDNLTGPALGPALKAWVAYPKSDLYRFIRNSQGMIRQRHPRALKVWKEYKPVIMNSFPGLTDEDIEAIVAYIQSSEVIY